MKILQRGQIFRKKDSPQSKKESEILIDLEENKKTITEYKQKLQSLGDSL